MWLNFEIIVLGKQAGFWGVFPTLGGHIDINLSKGHVMTLVAAEAYKMVVAGESRPK